MYSKILPLLTLNCKTFSRFLYIYAWNLGYCCNLTCWTWRRELTYSMSLLILSKRKLNWYHTQLLSGFHSLHYTKDSLPPSSIQKDCWRSKPRIGTEIQGCPVNLFPPGRVYVSGDYVPACISDMFLPPGKNTFQFFFKFVKANLVYLEYLAVLYTPGT